MAKTPLELAALATAAVPGLRATELRPPQFEDDTVSVSGLVDAEGTSWIVVADKRGVTKDEFQQGLSVLEYLGECSRRHVLSFEVPQVRGAVATSPTTFASVYSDPGGTAVTDEQLMVDGLLAASLGRALGSLHALDPTGLLELALPFTTAEATREQLRQLIGSGGPLLPARLRARWLLAVDDKSLWNFESTAVHGDLASRSVLAEEGAVLAVTNFRSLTVGDPARDLAWILPLADNSFLDRFQQAYSRERIAPDLHLMTRAQLHSELALVRWLVYGQESNDQGIIVEAQEMLTELDQDLAGAQLVKSSRPVAEISFSSEEEPLNLVRKSRSESLDTEPSDEFVVIEDDEPAPPVQVASPESPAAPPASAEAPDLLTEDLSAVVDDILAGHEGSVPRRDTEQDD